jgi:hypothetical protein
MAILWVQHIANIASNMAANVHDVIEGLNFVEIVSSSKEHCTRTILEKNIVSEPFY